MTDNPIRVALADDPGLEQAVVAYLERHGDFFDRHPGLLAELSIPHPTGGGAVSLIERQVEALRGEVSRYRNQIRDLVRVARDNDQLSRRLHRMTLDLIDATDFTEVMNILEDHLHEQFKTDAVELKLFSAARGRDQQAATAGHGDADYQEFRTIFDQGRPLCGRLSQRHLDYLFGPEADDVQSAALLPLPGEEVEGLLAIGSSEPDRFHADMGTELLERLAEIVSRKLQVVSLPGV
jgi:uncharacterized protein YigA (DUF484 family)